MVERIAHLEVAEVMRRLSMPVKMMMPSSERLAEGAVIVGPVSRKEAKVLAARVGELLTPVKEGKDE